MVTEDQQFLIKWMTSWWVVISNYKCSKFNQVKIYGNIGNPNFSSLNTLIIGSGHTKLKEGNCLIFLRTLLIITNVPDALVTTIKEMFKWRTTYFLIIKQK